MTFAAPKSGTWQSLLAEGISTPSEIACYLGISAESLSEIVARYPARINPYALNLMVVYNFEKKRYTYPL
ncbi:MAG: hypothetical protein KGY38_02075 [Desulfobacterales bacterium]|nr:hypothetical protein [Desulfobacterales bacterium]